MPDPKMIEIIDFVRGPNPHLLIVADGVTYRRFFTAHDLDLARYLANEFMTFVIAKTDRAEGL